jgi:mono/diheme cytochrome c family protein
MRAASVLVVVPVLLLASCGERASEGTAATPAYYPEVEAIVQTRCAGCHTDGGVAPFPLASYEDVRARASLIADVVEARVMPPWPPSDRGVPLLHSRALTDEQVRTVVSWARAGAPEGPAAQHEERRPELPTIRPDLALEMAESYVPDPTVTDDYRCFVVDPGLAETRYLTGYDIVPESPGVHHVILFLVLEEGLERLAELDAADPAYGYPCFGATGVESTAPIPPVRALGGWVPGTGPTPLPAGTGLAIPPGSRLVMQVHYNVVRSAAPDRTSAVLELSGGEGLVPAVNLPLWNLDFSVPAGARNHVVEATSIVPVPGRLHGLFPHMHLHGTSISVSLARPSGETLLIDIPRWDFHWQGSYTFAAPERLSPGDVLKLRCVFENVSGTVPLTWGERTEDEMCLSAVYVSP